MPKARIESVFNPRSIALVGASDREGTLGDIIRRNLEQTGFKGTVEYVNPAHAEIGGRTAYRRVRDLPGPVDVAIIVAPAKAVPDIITECGEKGIRGAIIVSAGFRDGGDAGRQLEAEVKRRARQHGVRFLGPNSLGLIRTDVALNAACGPRQPRPGRLAFVSQSGALCAAVIDWARGRQVGFSTVISTGVGADIGLGEILDFLVHDPATDSIMLYMESVDDARRFMSALRAAARVKPVVVMKAGRHAERPDAAAFHTGSLVGADDVFDAAMRRAGSLRIRDLYDLFTAAATLGAGARVRGRRLAIVSNAGGPGALAADHATDRWLLLPKLTEDTARQLEALLPTSDARANPVYVRADADAEQFASAARLVLEDPGVEALLAILTPYALTDPDRLATELVAIAGKQRKPVFACWMGGESVASSRDIFAASKVPSYSTPESAVDAIAALALYTANQEQLLQVPEPLGPTSTPDRAAAQAIIDASLEAGQEWLDPAESKSVLAAFGIPVLRSVPAHSASEAVKVAKQAGFPVAMKILSPDIPHKTDVGGVRLGLSDEASVRSAYTAMTRQVARLRPDAKLEGVLIERMYGQGEGREVMVGVLRDPVFGPAISFGLGGTLVEVVRDRAVALPPLNTFLVRDLIRRTRASVALQPLRGAPAADEEAVEDILLRVSELVCEMPGIGSIDLNPVIVTERGAVVVDARLGVMRSPPEALPYSHVAIHPYPSNLLGSVELPDGTVARVRPIRPEDAAIEAAFVHGLSEQSKFLRFMFAIHDLTPAQLSRFTQIDYDREMALIAVIDAPGGEQQIAVARYITLADEETCEFAIVVGDDWQGKGLARRLFGMLIDTARARRLKVMTGVTLRENARMLDLARSKGFGLRMDEEDPTLVRMTLDLQAPPRAPDPPAG
ncbi:MAG: bifunctional acetate--CoA ligase family protein/GNAT family N-acetyltransferase [Gammaproteobacteria bacterium]|nr:bifunctional acetate--CoA ligase family protein/GNAT family N-acetyltransferase [Gammaproteobacteria bacterium]